MSIETEIAELDKQILALKQKRNNLIVQTNFESAQLKRILAFRTPTKTLCQMLRELYDLSDIPQREKIGKCLLIAKKMNDKLVEYYGSQYSANWYDKNGNFIEG